jgi:hypothetical protein
MSQATEIPSPKAFDRAERAGSPGLVLGIAGLLVGAAASFSFMPPEDAGRLTILLLALLAREGRHFGQQHSHFFTAEKRIKEEIAVPIKGCELGRGQFHSCLR